MILLLGIVAGFLVWNQFRDPVADPGQGKPEPGLSFGELERIQNDSARKMQMQQERAVLENAVSAPRVQSASKRADEVPLVVDVRKNSAALEAEPQRHQGQVPLDSQLNNFLAERERYEQLQGERKQSYAEAFIRKARRMGYEVTIDQDYQIVDIRRTKAGGSQ